MLVNKFILMGTFVLFFIYILAFVLRGLSYLVQYKQNLVTTGLIQISHYRK